MTVSQRFWWDEPDERSVSFVREVSMSGDHEHQWMRTTFRTVTEGDRVTRYEHWWEDGGHLVIKQPVRMDAEWQFCTVCREVRNLPGEEPRSAPGLVPRLPAGQWNIHANIHAESSSVTAERLASPRWEPDNLMLVESPNPQETRFWWDEDPPFLPDGQTVRWSEPFDQYSTTTDDQPIPYDLRTCWRCNVERVAAEDELGLCRGCVEALNRTTSL